MFNEREDIFEFTGPAEDSDNFAIEITIKIARRILKDPKVTPQRIVGLGHALYALETSPFGFVYFATILITAEKM